MTTCNKCGHEGAGTFCANCGAPLRFDDEATSTAGTQLPGDHREGWGDEATYTGYSSYPSQPSGTPRPAPYRSAPLGTASTAPAGNAHKTRRGNQMLAALVGVAAVAVFALVAYLFLKPGGGNGGSHAAPTVNSSSVITSSSASSSSSQGSQPQQTVTRTATQSADAPGGGGSGGSNSDGEGNFSAVPNLVTSSGNYAVSRSGGTATVYQASASGGQPVGTLTLNGSGSDSDLTMGSLPGCKAPIIAWNPDSTRSSAAFGMSSSGSYQMFKAVSGQYDMAPIGGDGSGGHSMGVYLTNSNIGFNDSDDGYDRSQDNNFDSCNSDGVTLHFSGTGSGD